MSIPNQKPRLQKVCFVTVGATASFDSLIKATLSPPFLEALKTHGYTHLRLQHGKDGQKMLDEFRGINHAADRGEQDLRISGFDFNKHGLGSEMRDAKGEGNRVEGVVVSHAGWIYFYPTNKAETYVADRIWLYPRRPTNCCPHYRRAQSRVVGQSPGRVSRRAGYTRIRYSWTPQVRSLGVLCQDNSLTFAQ